MSSTMNVEQLFRKLNAMLKLPAAETKTVKVPLEKPEFDKPMEKVLSYNYRKFDYDDGDEKFNEHDECDVCNS